MSDLFLATALILSLACALFVAGLKISAIASPRLANLLAFATVALLYLYVQELQESALLSHLLPFSSLMVLGAWQPLFGGFLGGQAWGRVKGTTLRKSLCVVPLLAVALFAAYGRFLGSLPWTEGRDFWKRGVCMQTSASSCSAASAATLLQHYGISANETEMAKLCFTRSGKGTTWFGLYRGLKLKTAGTPWDVEIVSWNDAQLRENSSPLILSVRLDPRPDTDPRFERNWGWAPGVQHAVVLFGFRSEQRVEMGDPSAGREFWSEQAIHELWHGDAMRLVARPKQ